MLSDASSTSLEINSTRQPTAQDAYACIIPALQHEAINQHRLCDAPGNGCAFPGETIGCYDVETPV